MRIVEGGEQRGYRPRLAGQDQVRPHVGERLQHEPARSGAGVGQCQVGVRRTDIPEGDDVDVEGPRQIAHRAPRPAQPSFDGVDEP